MVVLLPIMAFMFVFLVIYALLAKTRLLGGNTFIHFFVSFIIAIIFAMSPTATEFTVMTIPWIAVLLVAVLSILLAFALLKGNLEDIVKNPIVAMLIIIVTMIIFLVSALNVFGPFFAQYMPGPQQQPGLISFLINPSVLGAIVLTIIAAIASWVLTKK
jgi:hypothetical protein